MKVDLLALGVWWCLLTSCAAPPKKEPQQSSPQQQLLIQSARQAVIKNDLSTAETFYKKAILTAPDSDLADDAQFELGRLYFQNNRIEEAYREFLQVLNSPYSSNLEVHSAQYVARCLMGLRRFEEAYSFSHQMLKKKPDEGTYAIEWWEFKLTAAQGLRDQLKILSALVRLSQLDVKRRDEFRSRAIAFTESDLDEPELKAVVRSSDFDFLRPTAAYALGILAHSRREMSAAQSYLTEVVELAPGSSYAVEAQKLLSQIDSRRKVNPLSVGVALPLSGKMESVGRKSLRGLQLGLGVFGPRRSQITLAVVDTEANPDVARRQFESLIVQDHCIAVVGGLLSKTASSIANKSEELGVPTILLSQKSGLTDTSDYVFRNAMTANMQIEALVDLAMQQMGLKRFGILYPNDAYGVEMADLFWSAVKQRGGEVRAVQVYAPGTTSFTDPVKRLLGLFYLEDRETEYQYFYQKWLAQQKVVSQRVSPPEYILPPVVDFDALFVPDSTSAIGQIAPTLAIHDAKNIQLLGTNIWHTSSLIRRGDRYIEGAVFMDALASESAEFKATEFFRDYVKTFGEEPGWFELQAYEAGLIIQQLLVAGVRSRDEFRQRLVSVRRFAGGTDWIELNTKREFIRKLIPLTVSQGQISNFKTKL